MMEGGVQRELVCGIDNRTRLDTAFWNFMYSLKSYLEVPQTTPTNQTLSTMSSSFAVGLAVLVIVLGSAVAAPTPPTYNDIGTDWQ